jgi:hypothetical protein
MQNLSLIWSALRPWILLPLTLFKLARGIAHYGKRQRILKRLAKAEEAERLDRIRNPQKYQPISWDASKVSFGQN